VYYSPHLLVLRGISGLDTGIAWKAWADGGVADPALFDYNDSFNNVEAGSPDLNSSEYPVKKLNLVDSLCWVPYNFQPTSEKTGSCYKAQAKVKPKSRRVPAPN
jgi:hypothetical protein